MQSLSPSFVVTLAFLASNLACSHTPTKHASSGTNDEQTDRGAPRTRDAHEETVDDATPNEPSNDTFHADSNTSRASDTRRRRERDTRGAEDTSSNSPLVTGRPYRVSSTDVTFQSEQLTMKGTLSRPAERSAPSPGVVILHGSGPTSRKGKVEGQLNMRFPKAVPVYAEIAQHLAARGYAVLRYDKRSCGPFNNCASNGYPRPSSDLEIQQFAEDATAAIDALSDRSGIASNEIYVVGHSQGAQLAVLAASRRPDRVQGAVLMAGTPAGPDETIRYQYERSLQALQKTGLSKTRAKEQLSRLGTAAEQLETLKADQFDGSTILGQSTVFWTSWFRTSRRVRALVPQLSQPLLSLSGTADRNVPPRLARQWQPLFEQGTPRLEHRWTVQNCIAHAMNCITESTFLKIQADDIGRSVHPKVRSRLVTYLDRVHHSF